MLAGETIDIEIEVPYPTPMGRRWMHFVVAPTFDAGGAVDGCVAVITDDTHLRELERERARALAELKEIDRRKDEFLAMLSHELRNPLAPILTAVEILRLAPNDAATSATARDVIERQVAHMKRLLDDLLDVSRVSQGKIALRREVLDLAIGPAAGGRGEPAAHGGAAAAALADDTGGVDPRRRRSGAPGPGVRQPAEQRREVLGARQHDRARDGGRGRRGRRARARPGASE